MGLMRRVGHSQQEIYRMIRFSPRASLIAIAAMSVAVSSSALAQSARSADAAPPPPQPAMAMQPAKAAADMQTVLDQLAALAASRSRR